MQIYTPCYGVYTNVASKRKTTLNNMETKLETIRGYYNPSFFKLVVNADCELDDLNKLQIQHFSTFFHEYIHFIQDVTTTFGLINTSIVSDRLKYFNKEFINNTSSNVAVPLPLHNHNTTETNYELQNIYLGIGVSKHRDRIPKVEKVTLIDTHLKLGEPHNKYVQEVIVDYSFSSAAFQFKFGALCLLENMAHIIQCKFFPEVQHPEIPYRAAELVAQYIYPVIGNNFDKVFALCDVCLMTFHPGETYFKILVRMKEDSWNGDAKYIYEYVRNEIKTFDGKDIYTLFNEKSDETNSHLQDYFTTSIFDEESKWLKTVLEQAKSIRLGKPSFLLDILYSSNLPSTEFVDLFTNLGTPLMMNYVGDAWFHPPKNYFSNKIQPDRIAAIYEIFSLFEYGKKNCDLKHYCMATVSVDKRCNNEPWTRYNDAQVCAYGQFWKTWDLFNKTPV
jgi:hypothetical protein